MAADSARPARAKATPPGTPVAELEREIAFLMRALEAAQRLHTYPLERAHYLVLGVIEDGGPQTVASIAQRLLLDDSTVTRQVMEMERLHLVGKRTNPADRRSAIITITARGKAATARMRAERMERLAYLVRDWSPAEQEQFVGLLARFNGAVAQRVRDNPV